jgi:hypothetical protein
VVIVGEHDPESLVGRLHKLKIDESGTGCAPTAELPGQPDSVSSG